MKLTNFILSVFHEISGGQFEENCQFGENDHFQKSWWGNRQNEVVQLHFLKFWKVKEKYKKTSV